MWCSFSKVVEQKEQLEQKHLHLLHILDSERQAKWHYVQQMEELSVEVKKLKDEVSVKFQACIKVLDHVNLFVAVLQNANRHGLWPALEPMKRSSKLLLMSSPV
jgi:hypothetical protein